MAKLILYLLESSALLAFLYLIYILVLSKETFFSLNRFFLLGILVVSLLFPLLSLDFIPTNVIAVERPIKEISKFRMSYYEAMALWEFESNGTTTSAKKTDFENTSPFSTIGWFKIFFPFILVIYSIGIVVCLSRTAWTLRWIRKMIATSPKVEMDGVKIVKIPREIAPFSFFRYVFAHNAMINTPEFDHILAHERTHIEQRHSIDLIFVQFLAAFFWFNPLIWQLIKSLKTTHEYIADKKIINSGYSLVEYQTVLLKQLISNNSIGLVHNFNLSLIKKRIAMMKNKKSGWSGKVRVSMAITAAIFCCAIIIQCNSKLDDGPISFENHLSDETKHRINLPVAPNTGYKFEGDRSDALTFTIANDKLLIDGKPYRVIEIMSMLNRAGKPSPNGHIVMQIDKDQKMGFVRDVEMELRKADRRKIMYVGQTLDGADVEAPILLPPTIENAKKNGVPVYPDIDDVEAEGKTDIFKISAGDYVGADNQKKVYDFLQGEITKQSSKYVVSLRYDNDDTYEVYLPALVYIKEGFNQIYQERAQKMFGKNYFDVTKEEYYAVRKNLPMAISIAEK
jgi:biopolymer transport protein ExbD